ncbi:hypothetical protein Hanom_Chr03g00211931 [Helianthus anomalus]
MTRVGHKFYAIETEKCVQGFPTFFICKSFTKIQSILYVNFSSKAHFGFTHPLAYQYSLFLGFICVLGTIGVNQQQIVIYGLHLNFGLGFLAVYVVYKSKLKIQIDYYTLFQMEV